MVAQGQSDRPRIFRRHYVLLHKKRLLPLIDLSAHRYLFHESANARVNSLWLLHSHRRIRSTYDRRHGLGLCQPQRDLGDSNNRPPSNMSGA